MSKVICAICGTSYPNNVDTCPVCGYVQDFEQESPVESVGYTPVKGGRFSASNVKKRNGSAAAFAKAPESQKYGSKKKSQSNVGAIIVIVLLLLAIVAVAGYITLRFFVPNDFLYEGLDGIKIFGNNQQLEEPPVAPENELSDVNQEVQPSLDCSALVVRNDIFLNDIGATYQLSVMPVPADTVDEIVFESSDESVVTVSESGLITAVAEGEAVVSIHCGSVVSECYIVVTKSAAQTELVKFMLNRKEIDFYEEGESWVLYDGVIPQEEIVWFTDDMEVATIENGKVVAVGAGETVVYGVYGGQTASCLIRCAFDANEGNASGDISQATGEQEQDDNKTYSLHNPQGQANDVTIGVGKTFVLQLIDENKNVVTDAKWTVEDTDVCTYSPADGTVTGVHGGMTHVTATYKGNTYSCIVRVA